MQINYGSESLEFHVACNAQHGIFVKLQSGQSSLDFSKIFVLIKNIFQDIFCIIVR